VSIIDRTTGLVSPVTTGTNPQGVVITPDGSRAYVSNYTDVSPSATVINVPSASVVATITLNPRPSAGAVSGDGSVVFIPSAFDPPGPIEIDDIARISTSSNTVGLTLSSANPGCVVAAPDGVTFVSCRAVIASVGLFTVSSTSVTSVPLPGGAATAAAFSPDSRTVYLANSIFDVVNVVDVATATVTATTAVGDNPSPIAVRPDGQRIFVGNQLGSTVSVLSASGTVIATTPVGGSPSYIGVSNDGRYVLVATSAGNLVVLDSTGTQILTTLALGGTPGGLAVARSGNFAAVSVNSTDQVVLIDLPLAEATGDNIPTAPIQQYVPEPGEVCGENPPASVDFQALVGLRNAGWGRSWAEWPNSGRGGTVCSRQPYFTSGGTWAIR
jgi:YVTN family beta-propeller protein